MLCSAARVSPKLQRRHKLRESDADVQMFSPFTLDYYICPIGITTLDERGFKIIACFTNSYILSKHNFNVNFSQETKNNKQNFWRKGISNVYLIKFFSFALLLIKNSKVL